MRRIFAILVYFFLLLVPAFTYAQPGPVVIDIPNPLNTTSFTDFIDNLIDFLFAVSIPLTILVILWAALLFITSGGNEKKLGQAKAALLWAVVGFAIMLVSKGIVAVICDFFGATC